VDDSDDFCCLAQEEDQTVVFEDPPIGVHNSPFFEESSQYPRRVDGDYSIGGSAASLVI
jgi:hypothetical protein